jgi:hypothetical protein
MAGDDDWSDPTVVELPEQTQRFQQGGIVGHMTRQLFGEPDPEIRARMDRAARRLEFRARVRTVQEVAITVGIIVLVVLAAAVLLRLYNVVGEVWT